MKAFVQVLSLLKMPLCPLNTPTPTICKNPIHLPRLSSKATFSMEAFFFFLNSIFPLSLLYHPPQSQIWSFSLLNRQC